MTLDEGARNLHTAIEIERGDNSFESVGEQGGLLTATALLLAPAQAEHGTEADTQGDASKMAAADKGGAQAGEFTLAGVREAAVEALGDSQSQNSIADELKLLVVGVRVEQGLGAGLVGQRAVGQGQRQQFRVFETVIPWLGRCLAR